MPITATNTLTRTTMLRSRMVLSLHGSATARNRTALGTQSLFSPLTRLTRTVHRSRVSHHEVGTACAARPAVVGCRDIPCRRDATSSAIHHPVLAALPSHSHELGEPERGDCRVPRDLPGQRESDG